MNNEEDICEHNGRMNVDDSKRMRDRATGWGYWRTAALEKVESEGSLYHKGEYYIAGTNAMSMDWSPC